MASCNNTISADRELGEQNLDDAYVVSAEYQMPSYVIPWARLAFFVDHGAGRLRTPTITESRGYSMTGAGLGTRVQLPFYQTSLNADVGFPVGAKPQGGTLAGDRSPTVYLQLVARF